MGDGWYLLQILVLVRFLGGGLGEGENGICAKRFLEACMDMCGGIKCGA